MSNQEWNYFQCNQCYVMFPHLAVPDICVCGNDMQCNSTRKKFVILNINIHKRATIGRYIN